jgi:CHAT domain-containing protein/tetratricopeptide (TPR) repeat protein
MNQTINEEEAIKQYLLGRLSEEEQTPLEERLLTHDDFFERLKLAEDELIEEYLAGTLPGGDRERFDSHFMAAPERKQKLRFSMALRKYVTGETITQRERGAGSPKGTGPARGTEPSDAGRRNGAAKGGSKLKTNGSGIEVEPAEPGSRVVRGPWARIASNPYLRIAACLAIIFGVGLGLWRGFIYQSDVDKGLAALRDAYKSQRPLQARITALNYAPFPETRGSDQGNVDKSKHDRAQRILLDAFDEHPGSASEHALGEFYLADRQFDAAIDHLKRAAESDQASALYHSDLGAALLEKARFDKQRAESDGNEEALGKSFEELVLSREHLDKAIELKPSLLEALFNRALCRQEMKLPQAEDDWKEYLKRDPSSQWGNEARKNLQLLEDQRTRRSRTNEELFSDFEAAYQSRNDTRAWDSLSFSRARNGNVITERLLDQYMAISSGAARRQPSISLKMLLYAGEIESRKAGDRFTFDLANFYKHASLGQLSVLARARGFMRLGHQCYDRSEFEQAIDAYSTARRLFAEPEDRCEALFAESWIGNCYLRIPDAKHSFSIFRRLSNVSKLKGYRWLFGQSLNGLTDAETSASEPSRALEYANEKLALSAKLQDLNGVLMTLEQPLNMHLEFGEYTKALGFGLRGLNLSASLAPSSKVRWTFYHQIAYGLYSLGSVTSALDFEEEAVRLAEESGWPLIRSRAYTQLGLIYAGLSDYENAIQNCLFALREGEGIQGELSKLNVLANSTLNLAHLNRQAGRYRIAIEHYDRAMELYGKLNNLQVYLYEAHKGRLMSFLGLGEEEAAREEFRTTLSLYERYRSRILGESNRNSFFDVGQTIYDLAIDFQYSTMQDPRMAFEYAEASRARSLLDLMHTSARVVDGQDGPEIRSTSAERPLPLADIQKRIPDQAQLLEFSVLDDKVIIWVVSTTTFHSRAQDIRLTKLNEKVAEFVSLVSNPSRCNGAARLSSELYELLIEPVEALLDKSKILCVVPDKALNYVPYCSLVSRRTGKCIAETYASMISPSSTTFVLCSEIAKAREAVGQEKLLAVGNPAFDSVEFPFLPSLPSAAREATEISTYYESSPPLIGGNATRLTVLRNLVTCDVAHFAAHCVVNERSYLLSEIALAKDMGGPQQRSRGSLNASDIYRMRLPRTRLVVLSACQTAIERSYRGEGAIGIARPFIAAGVPQVVASLWPVDSSMTSQIMISFHRHRRQDGASSIEALRRAQLDMLKGRQEPLGRSCGWASFAVIGGYAHF